MAVLARAAERVASGSAKRRRHEDHPNLRTFIDSRPRKREGRDFKSYESVSRPILPRLRSSRRKRPIEHSNKNIWMGL